MPLEALGWFFTGAGVVLFGIGLGFGFARLRHYIRRKRFDAFVGRLRTSVEKVTEAAKEPKKGREVSELNFRDKSGVFTTVKIVVDHDLPDLMVGSKAELAEMLKKGDAGAMSDLLKTGGVPDGAKEGMNKVEEFVFSPKAVRDMRSVGMEPDEVVTKMLKASGRMD